MEAFPSDPQPAQPVVVIGSSAGGIEALSTLLSALPQDFPAPIVIAQHHDPTRPHQLVRVLSRACAMPVQLVADGEPLQPGTVYLVPPDRAVEFADSMVHLVPSDNAIPRPSVDRLFTNAAAAFRDQVIAVVLSGTGFDGASGARMVHEVNGTVVIQNPETAAFPGMPRALAPVTVDIVADLDEIGSLLLRLVADEPGLETRSDQAEIIVRDCGAGNLDADLVRIFTRISQAEGQTRSIGTGLGLGLYVAKEVVTAHGGTIEATSHVGQDTTFTIRLPLYHGEPLERD